MRIALDADHLYQHPLRGIQKTTVALYEHLALARPAWTVTALHRAPGPCRAIEQVPTVTPTPIDFRGERILGPLDFWDAVRLPAATFGADLVHAPSNHGPWWAPAPIVLTIHDLTPIEFPDGDTPHWWRRVRHSARAATRIVTCSHHVARRIAEELPDTAGRIEVIYWGRPAGYEPVALATAEAVAQRVGITGPFVLAFGTPHPRKNVRRLLEAWAELPASVTAEVELVVVGSIGDLEPRLPDRARVIRNLDEADIPAIITAATALCYVSLSEGFGLPVLEAFCCGTPVLASNSSSLPEVAGDAATLVDPLSTAAISQGLRRLLGAESLRAEQREAGLERAGSFSWTKCADEYAAMFERVALS